MTPLFLDTEFTGLRQGTTLISLALVAADGHEFYAEFSDYDRAQCDAWIEENVLGGTLWLRSGTAPFERREGDRWECLGTRAEVAAVLRRWLEETGPAEVWADAPAWDWVLLCELFGGAMGLPKCLYYLPFDLTTLLKARGLDPDADREVLAGPVPDGLPRHNALHDARVTRAVWQRLHVGQG